MSELPNNFKFHTTQETHTHLDADGKPVHTQKEVFSISVDVVKSIGIAHLEDVVSHDINHVLNSTSHVVRFKDGSDVQFAYSHSGELLEFSSNNIAIQIDESGKLMVIRKLKPE
jgi:hypothetical protein